MKIRQVKKLQKICEHFLRAGCIPPVYAQKKLKAAGEEMVSVAYMRGLWKPTISEQYTRYIVAM